MAGRRDPPARQGLLWCTVLPSDSQTHWGCSCSWLGFPFWVLVLKGCLGPETQLSDFLLTSSSFSKGCLPPSLKFFSEAYCILSPLCPSSWCCWNTEGPLLVPACRKPHTGMAEMKRRRGNRDPRQCVVVGKARGNPLLWEPGRCPFPDSEMYKHSAHHCESYETEEGDGALRSVSETVSSQLLLLAAVTMSVVTVAFH